MNNRIKQQVNRIATFAEIHGTVSDKMAAMEVRDYFQSLEGEAVGEIKSDFESEIKKVAEELGYPCMNKLLVKHGAEDSKFYAISWVQSAWLVWQEAYKLYTTPQPPTGS